MPIMALQADGPVRTPEWTRQSVAVDVPAEAERIQISLVVTGNGAGWFGDLDLEATDSAQSLTEGTYVIHKQQTMLAASSTTVPSRSPWSPDLWR